MVSFRPLSRYEWVPTSVSSAIRRSSANRVSVPSRGMGGFLQNKDTWLQTRVHIVSVPSRGMGGFLRYANKNGRMRGYGFRPLSRYGWVPTLYKNYLEDMGWKSFRPLSRYRWFPTCWQERVTRLYYLGFLPLSRYGWFPTKGLLRTIKVRPVSVPSRGMGDFLQ